MIEFLCGILSIIFMLTGFLIGSTPEPSTPEFYKSVGHSWGKVNIIQNAQGEEYYLFVVNNKLVKVKVQ